MLVEFPEVRQEREGFRRLFLDDYLSLYVWYEGRGGEILGFQLTYLEELEQKAFTWTRKEGFSHDSVEGWDASRFNKTPILVQDGVFDEESMLAYARENMKQLEDEIRDLVLGKIAEYGRRRIA
jgi:hypothetical protein